MLSSSPGLVRREGRDRDSESHPILEGDAMKVQAYLNFDGRCEEAIGFYRRTLGAEVERVMRFKDSPEPCSPDMVPPGSENKVMHASFRIGETMLMASDCNSSGKANFQGISLALTV